MRRTAVKSRILVMLVAMCVVFCGCSFNDSSYNSTTEYETTTETVSEEKTTLQVVDEITTEAKEEKTESKTVDESTLTDSDKNESETARGAVEYPPYDGEAFVQLEGNSPDFSDEEKKNTEAFEEYSELDSLGRCGVAYANICKEIMPTEERGEIGEVKPTGWHLVKYPELIEDNYLYNRSHLIAFSLAGENANKKNLITGTRYLNQETMQIFELKVLDYVRSTDNHVLYRVTPVFEGDNLVATGVQMEAWSVEDEGEGICYNVFCYNVQPGIDIDYATGDSKVSEKTEDDAKQADDIQVEGATEKVTESTTESRTETETKLSGEDEVRSYILNTNSKKIHLPTCSSVDDMAEHNKKECESSITELKKQGYDPCGRCLAEYR